MPVSLHQRVEAFSIMWRMKLKCRTAVATMKPYPRLDERIIANALIETRLLPTSGLSGTDLCMR